MTQQCCPAVILLLHALLRQASLRALLDPEPLWSLVRPLPCRLCLPNVTSLEIKVKEELMNVVAKII